MKWNEYVFSNVVDHIKDGIYILDNDRRIVYWNKSAERISGFDSSEVVGSSCKDNILNHVTSDGLKLCKEEYCPAFRTLMTGQTCESDDVFLHHKNGHRVGVTVRTSPVRDKSGQIQGVLELFQEKKERSQIEEELSQLKKLLTLDKLTNVGNRAFAEDKIVECLNQFQRYRWPFGVTFFDIDHFKKFNDNYGHETGDEVLKMVAETVRSNIRCFDHIFRWGGEEFVLVCINVDEGKIAKIAEKIRSLVENSFLTSGDDKLKVTISCGVTTCKEGDSLDAIVKRADELMYRSKEAGRNRVSVG